MKLAESRWRYGPGYINLNERGTYSCFVCLGHRQRRRATFKTLSDAKAWIMAGTDCARPDQALVEDALRARSMLPDDVTLEEAARYWAGRHKGANPTTVAKAWESYRGEVSRLIRPRTMASYRQAVTALIAHVGAEAQLDNVTPERVEEFLAGHTPVMRNNHIRALSAFFSWCVAHGYAVENAAAPVKRARIPQTKPAVFTPDEVRRLLAVAADIQPRTVAYFALGFFAGLRPDEARRVRPSNIANGWIVLDGDITKTADARTVAVRPCLAAWLAKYPVPENGSDVKRIKAVRAAWGAWKQDVARHSYATYAYEESHDAVRVASEMGHAGTEVFFRHYRALAAPGSSKAYFSILPP